MAYYTQPAGTMSQQTPVDSLVAAAAAQAKVATQHKVPLAMMSHRNYRKLSAVDYTRITNTLTLATTRRIAPSLPQDICPAPSHEQSFHSGHIPFGEEIKTKARTVQRVCF